MTTVAEKDFPASDFGLRTIEDPISLSQSKLSAASLAQPNHLSKYTSRDAKKTGLTIKISYLIHRVKVGLPVRLTGGNFF